MVALFPPSSFLAKVKREGGPRGGVGSGSGSGSGSSGGVAGGLLAGQKHSEGERVDRE